MTSKTTIIKIITKAPAEAPIMISRFLSRGGPPVTVDVSVKKEKKRRNLKKVCHTAL